MMAPESESGEPEDVTPEADNQEDAAPGDIQGVVREEFELLTADIDDATGDSPPEDAAAIEDVAVLFAHVLEASASTCHLCGRKGRRAGDLDCPGGSGRGALATNIVGDEDGDFEQDVHCAVAVHMLVDAHSSGRGVRDAGCGIVGAACVMTVIGESW